jgi:hypothetical protein
MRFSDQGAMPLMRLAHRFAVPLSSWGIDPIAHRRRDRCHG